MSDRTTISDVIEALESIKEEHGDLPVLVDTSSGRRVYISHRHVGPSPPSYAVIGLDASDDVIERGAEA